MTNSMTNMFKAIPKTIIVAAFILVASLSFKAAETKAQDFSTGVDFYSTYVWRGTSFAGPSIQPFVEMGAGNFTLGAWGSQPFNGEGQEMDLYASYSFDFGLSLGVTDYYYPPSDFFDYEEGGSHAVELNAGYGINNISLSANFILNEGAGSDGGDLYFEGAYSFEPADVFIGAGNGWHTVESMAGEDPNPDGTYDDVFSIVNMGVSTYKDIEITDSFSLPLSGSVILNPYTEQFFIVVGLSL